METFNNIISGNELVLVDFYATWCGPCKMMHPVLDTLKQNMGDKVRIVKIDVDRNEAAAAQYGIQAVPTLMLMRNGKVLWRQSGALPLDALTQVINQNL
ncbi:MAG: thioredoxin [Bacteroidaceae bacterium]|nr:thioredoxin [Prevotellaceae bacterium]MDY5631955.1 thioredoxin [Bacteroidaceae bacterium]